MYRDHPDFFEVWAERSGLLTLSPNWPAGLEIPAGPDHHWNLTLANVPHRVARASHVPVLDREEGQFFQPQALTIVYASPLIRVQEQTWAAGVFIAVASFILLGATVLLALYGIRRGLQP